jgi:hypothetical protein
MRLRPYGADAYLRYQLRSHMRSIRRDDARILYEGVSSLDATELAEACAERGMRATSLTPKELASQLQQWLELSAGGKEGQPSVPISLLIMSRAFAIEGPVAKISKDAAKKAKETKGPFDWSASPPVDEEAIRAEKQVRWSVR